MHRDLKPANILLTADHQTLKLTDFGLAKRFPRDDAAAGQGSPSRLVRTHTYKVGTPRYTAPEVLEGLTSGQHTSLAAVYTEKADVYSAALIIWYLLTGQCPIARVQMLPRARPELAGLLARMWAHDPVARPPAAECVATVRGMSPPTPACDGCSLQ
jgi:serine/threonine protein kinase